MGDPQNGWFMIENRIKMDGLGLASFQETSILGRLSIDKNTDCMENYGKNHPKKSRDMGLTNDRIREQLIQVQGIARTMTR